MLSEAAVTVSWSPTMYWSVPFQWNSSISRSGPVVSRTGVSSYWNVPAFRSQLPVRMEKVPSNPSSEVGVSWERRKPTGVEMINVGVGVRAGLFCAVCESRTPTKIATAAIRMPIIMRRCFMVMRDDSFQRARPLSGLGIHCQRHSILRRLCQHRQAEKSGYRHT